MRPKLLLADDSVTIQRVVELTFSGEDVQVVTVGDGEQAIARIPVEKPDVVLADIGMPKRSGYEVSAFVKGQPHLQHIPVLLLAGAFEPVDEAKAQEARCDGVLVKPFEPQAVVARVRELLDGASGSPTRSAAPDMPRPVARLTGASTAQVGPPKPDPEPAVPVPPADLSLDDYFDRLDAAFSTVGGTLPGPVIDLPDADLAVPTLDDVLGRAMVQPPAIEPPETSPTLSPSPAPVPSAPGRTPDAVLQPSPAIVADAFHALLALEAGEPGARPVRLTTAAPQPVLNDALIDEVVRRVVARLAPDTARAVVADVVSDVAERLVREEIARIRGK